MPQQDRNNLLLLAGIAANTVGTPQGKLNFAQILANVLAGRRQEEQSGLIAGRQQQFDARRFAREDAKANVALGLPPNATAEDRARFNAGTIRNQRFTAANEEAAGLEGDVGGLRQRVQTLPQGHPLRVAIEQRLGSMGADVEAPAAPAIGTEVTTPGGSVQPVERFKQLKDIQERTTLEDVAADARAGRAGPEEQGAAAEAVKAGQLRAEGAAPPDAPTILQSQRDADARLPLLQTANDQATEIETKFTGEGEFSAPVFRANLPDFLNFLRGTDGQLYRNAVRTVGITSLKTLFPGQLSDQEREAGLALIMPQNFDSPETMQFKSDLRKQMVELVARQARGQLGAGESDGLLQTIKGAEGSGGSPLEAAKQDLAGRR